MFILAIILIVCLLLILLYLCLLVRPRAKKPLDNRILCDYAHRGLHGGNIPENSLAAFSLACEHGYGIELDVQLSSDNEVMVFHDYTLLRMTGKIGNLSDFTCQELQTLTLGSSGETIPTLRQVLAQVDGKTPLLVELKGENLNVQLCKEVAKLLENYQGPYCIESFNPMLIHKIKKYLPKAYVGQLYTNVSRDKKRKSPIHLLLSVMAFNFYARPDFIAYNKKDRNSFPVKLTTHFYPAQKFVWTVKSDAELHTAHTLGEYPIFENTSRNTVCQK